MGLAPVIFDASFFSSMGREQSESTLQLLALSLTLTNCDFIARHPGIPTLYQSSVRYERRRAWKSIPVTFQSKRADCKSLACWLAADYTVHPFYTPWRENTLDKGYPPWSVSLPGFAETTLWALPEFSRQERGQNVLYHVRTRLCNGTLLDPSKVLGMR